MIAIADTAPATTGSVYRHRFARTFAANEAVLINDTNFPGLGAFLPGWVHCSTVADVHPQITIDGGTTWQFLSAHGGLVWADGHNVRLLNIVAAPRDASVWVLGLTSMEPVNGVSLATMGSVYRHRFARTFAANEAVLINDTNFPGLGAFLPGWVHCSSVDDVSPQITIDGGTTWQFLSVRGGLVWADGHNVRLLNIAAEPRDASVWVLGLTSMEPVNRVSPATMGSVYRRRFVRTFAANEAVVINDTNFPGLGVFLPGWIMCTSVQDVHPQITIDGGTTWEHFSVRGGLVWADGHNVRLVNIAAEPRDASVWVLGL
jgi:hypothetical protein